MNAFGNAQRSTLWILSPLFHYNMKEWVKNFHCLFYLKKKKKSNKADTGKLTGISSSYNEIFPCNS